MNSLIAMVDPVAGAGGAVVLICWFIIAPGALAAHLFVRRFFLVCFSISGFFTLSLVVLGLCYGGGTPSLWWSFVGKASLLSLGTCVAMGILLIPLRVMIDRRDKELSRLQESEDDNQSNS